MQLQFLLNLYRIYLNVNLFEYEKTIHIGILSNIIERKIFGNLANIICRPGKTKKFVMHNLYTISKNTSQFRGNI